MGKRRSEDDDDDEISSFTGPVTYSWQTTAIAARVQKVLDEMYVKDVPADVRDYFQRILYRKDKFDGGGGEEKIVLLIRTINESGGNEGALIEPIVSAVGSCMQRRWTEQGLKWIEAFDKLNLRGIVETMRSLDLFSEKNLSYYLSIVLSNKLHRLLDPPIEAPAPKIPRAERLAAATAASRASRLAVIEKNLELGRKLLELRAQYPGNKQFGRARDKHFGHVPDVDAAKAMRVARLYGERRDLCQATTWAVLLMLASPSLAVTRRQAFERRILMGEKVLAKEVKQAWVRNRLGTGLRKAA